jgi:hypothetical protein
MGAWLMKDINEMPFAPNLKGEFKGIFREMHALVVVSYVIKFFFQA